jgi:hypothetical protein
MAHPTTASVVAAYGTIAHTHAVPHEHAALLELVGEVFADEARTSGIFPIGATYYPGTGLLVFNRRTPGPLEHALLCYYAGAGISEATAALRAFLPPDRIVPMASVSVSVLALVRLVVRGATLSRVSWEQFLPYMGYGPAGAAGGGGSWCGGVMEGDCPQCVNHHVGHRGRGQSRGGRRGRGGRGGRGAAATSFQVRSILARPPSVDPAPVE